MREVLDERDFLEIETPILTRSTPEGARDFLVPSRMNAGLVLRAAAVARSCSSSCFMMAGFERYYQIARCFRDEDLRADRQPEFTQLDLEMAFVAEDDVIEVMEAVMEAVFAATASTCRRRRGRAWPTTRRCSRFGVDRPDTRFGLEIVDVGDAAARQRVQGLRERPRRRRRGPRDQRRRARALALGARGPQRRRRASRRRRPSRRSTSQDDARLGAATSRSSSRAEQIAAVNAELGAADGDLLLFVAD